MIRQWQVQPDLIDRDGRPVVSLQALQQALIEGAVMVHRAGGNLSLVVGRHPTELQGEMLTTGAVVTWMDRTDAKAQPETQRTLGAEAWSDALDVSHANDLETAQLAHEMGVEEPRVVDPSAGELDEDEAVAATEARIAELREQGKSDTEITAAIAAS